MTDAFGKIALIGLPRTGKSTYLGALWNLIQDDDDASIHEVQVKGDRSYLQFLGERVASLEEIRRTDVESEEAFQVTVGLLSRPSIELYIPDLSGETLRILVEDREWHGLLQAAIKGAHGILLFVHPNRVRQPIRTNFTDEMVTEFLTITPSIEEGDEVENTNESNESPRFKSRFACTAAQLIDAIENILDDMKGDPPIRLGIIISAWDEVDGQVTPQEWMEQELPAVWSLCQSNSDLLEVAIFGVSALGGRLPEEREDLLLKRSVYERAFACEGDGSPAPLSRPLEWALSS
jgi:hypothetical protein